MSAKFRLSFFGSHPDHDPDERPWYELSEVEKTERLNGRLKKLEGVHRLGRWAVGLAVSAAIAVLVKDLLAGYRITAVPPAPIVSNSAESMGADHVPKPEPPRP